VAALAGLVLVAVVVAAFVLLLRKVRSDRKAGIHRFGVGRLQGNELRLGGGSYRRTYVVTAGTRAEVVGSAQDARRSTVTRTLAGGVVAGPVGAIAGHAAKKKVTSTTAMLNIDGEDWTESLPVSSSDYALAVGFAQAINLAARKSAG
jgi:hypothetical protein